MAQTALERYVSNCRKKGYTEAQIREAMRKAGHPADKINAALGRKASDKPSILHKAEEIIFHPDEFFPSVAHEKLTHALLYLFVFSVLGAAAGALTKIILQVVLKIEPFMIIVNGIFEIVGIFWTAGWSVAGVFLGAAVFLLFAKLRKGDASYTDVFKVFVYSSTPTYISSIILGPIAVIVLITSLSTFGVEDITTGQALSAIGISIVTLGFLILVGIGIGIWSVVLFYKGMKFIFKKSGWWVTSVVALQFLVVVGIFLIIALIFAGIIYGIVSAFG